MIKCPSQYKILRQTSRSAIVHFFAAEKIFAVLISAFTFVLMMNFATRANSGSQNIAQVENPDSVKKLQERAEDYRNQYRNKNLWETLVSLPGSIVYLPFDITFKTIGSMVNFVDERKLVQKTHDLLTSDDGRRALLPVYSNRTGGGLRYRHKGLITSNSTLSVLTALGLRSRQKYQIKFERLQIAAAVVGDFSFRYRLLPEESFFGVGSDTDFEQDRSNYTQEQTKAEARFGLDLKGRLSAKVVAGYEINTILRGKNNSYPSTTELATEKSLPGLETGLNLFSLQAELRYDSREPLFRPRSGGIALFRGGLFQQTDQDRFAFWKAVLDLSQQIHLLYDRTLILRIAGEITEPFDDKLVPFYYLSELGREETIRGLVRSRFRDFDMVLGSIEYRYPIWEILDFFWYVDAGQIASDIFRDFSPSSLVLGYGGGIKIWGKEGIITDLTIARSEDGLRVYLGLNREL
ncbi:MAG: BamA/TamA family outer membrane protein [candidate division Zixibacteria bacterium]|nr:BamA/TamA family outer membrane protein [candidate division Zixibacteria bacterium]